MLQVPKQYEIAVDDYVFLRPQQSEVLIPQFANLYAYEQRKFEVWETCRE